VVKLVIPSRGEIRLIPLRRQALARLSSPHRRCFGETHPI
jgi:hypothetical protein